MRNVRDRYEILGREIRLADVIEATKKAYEDKRLKFSGRYSLFTRILTEWNTKHDSLDWHRDNQPETLLFLANLLK